MAPPEIHSKFSVTSGSLCFGDLAEICKGASNAIQPFPNVRPRVGGTVKAHKIEYNVAAENGNWNVYQLIDRERGGVSGWFVCHSTTVDDPGREMDKILRVSGSPYEPDSGSKMNNDKTAAEGIFVINRYDWISSSRNFDRDDNDSQSQEGPFDANMYGSAAGLIDHGQAISQVDAWRAQNPRPAKEAIIADSGIWMIIPHDEYHYGRFGFNNDRTAARSFLFFATNTDFTQTSFRGEDQETFRKKESHEERFARRLRDGYDFSGLEELNERCGPLTQEEENAGILRLYPLRPPEEKWLGPYDKTEHLFSPEEFVFLLHQGPILHDPPSFSACVEIDRPGRGLRFVEQLKEQVCDLINEMTLSYLESVVLGVLRSQMTLPTGLVSSPATAATSFAAALFPRHQDQDRGRTGDFMLYEYFLNALPMKGFETAGVAEKIETFFNSRLGEDEIKVGEREKEIMEKLSCVMVLLVMLLLDGSALCARDCNRDAIVPWDVRVIVSVGDRWMFEMFQYSRVFWKGQSS
ncbi:hypothetical protein IFM61606_05989 [Aspergillus udagawae]|nr:hypothetical protein IFM51744_03762 [Aspergillus udagawae]GFG17624.1 hypothetical protein IFM5058_08573 [Aspergillus udagawae]GFG26024.1 hypothetical protein IFM61606_05989 [Aspergillus udagawae]